MNSEGFQPPQHNYPPQSYNQQPYYQPGQYQPPPYPQGPQLPARGNLWQWYKSKGRFTKLGLGSGSLFLALTLCVCSLVAYGSTLPHQQMVQPTPTANSTLGQIATTDTTPTALPARPTAIPNKSVLGGVVSSFTAKFGKPTPDSDLKSYASYQPYNDVMSTNRYDIGVNGGHVYQITFNAPPDNPVSWQEGIKICQSFLPADAVFLSDQDFSPPNQWYQQMYMSKKMAHEFSTDHFMQGTGKAATPITPGTVQIMYDYSSWYDHTTNGAQIKLCYISLGEPH